MSGARGCNDACAVVRKIADAFQRTVYTRLLVCVGYPSTKAAEEMRKPVRDACAMVECITIFF